MSKNVRLCLARETPFSEAGIDSIADIVRETADAIGVSQKHLNVPNKICDCRSKFTVYVNTPWRFCSEEYPRGPANQILALLLALQKQDLGIVMYGSDEEYEEAPISDDLFIELARISVRQSMEQAHE